jgi:hypothetical protein
MVAITAPAPALTVVAVGETVALATVDDGADDCGCVVETAGADAVVVLAGEEDPQPTRTAPMAPGVSSFTSSAAPRLTRSH